MIDKFELIASKADIGQRIDKFLVAALEDCTRAAIQRAIKGHDVLVNGKAVKANYKLSEGDLISGHITVDEALVPLPEDIPIEVIYEDQAILIVNKATGIVVHPAPGNETGTLVNALLHYTGGNLSTLNGQARPGIVHRIDKDTTGLLIVAKNDMAHERLAQMLHDYDVTRKYHAIVAGNFTEEEGIINQPIGRHLAERTKMAVGGDNPRDALSFYKVIKQFKGYSYVEVTLHTGRTHQIRVHMSHIGHPVLGDLMYGPKKQRFSSTGQLLHAKILAFDHPITGEYMAFESSLPTYFQKVLDNLPQI